MTDRWTSPVLKESDGNVRPLRRIPVGETPFGESDLRDLLADSPALLPARHFDPVFADPVSLGTEFPVQGVGRIDALYLSPSGYLTVVEAKLWRNPEARRKVVSQVIDYARRLSKWSYSDLEGIFKERQQSITGAPTVVRTCV